MKIRLMVDVPVEPKHGMFAGRVFTTLTDDRYNVWVMGDAGEKVKLHFHEFIFQFTDDLNPKEAQHD